MTAVRSLFVMQYDDKYSKYDDKYSKYDDKVSFGGEKMCRTAAAKLQAVMRCRLCSLLYIMA